MKKTIYTILIAALIAIMTSGSSLAGTTISPKILVGQGSGPEIFAGVVKITPDAATGTITLNFQFKKAVLYNGVYYPGFCMTEAAIHVGLSLDDFPQNSGGAIPGQFDYHPDITGCVSQFTMTIPYPEGVGLLTYMAIHVVVDGGPLGYLGETGWTVRCGQLWEPIGGLPGGNFPGSNWSAYLAILPNEW